MNLSSPWGRGYPSDVDYISCYFADWAPINMEYLCLLQGINPPGGGDEFTYLDLGCGNAYGLALLAAANPKAEFYGVDFNPSHIFQGQELAREGRIHNLTLLEESFDRLDDQLLGVDFDYIVCHGVVSHVAPEVREAVFEVVGRKLKPHGAAFFCYNAMPGWGVQLPLQWLMSRYAQRHQESPEAMGLAFGEMEKLMDLQASYWSANPEVEGRMAVLKELDPHYLAHEYACEHVTPFYHAEFAAEMAQRRLRYVGSGQRIYNYPHLLLGQEQCAHLDSQPEALRETVKDFFVNQLIRRDVYSRGGVALPPVKVTGRVNQLRFVLGVPKDHVRYEAEAVHYGRRISLNGEFVIQVVDALDELGPATPMALAEHSGVNLAQVYSDLMTLWVTHQVHVIPATDADPAATSMVNFVLAMGGLMGQPTGQLASPVCRAGVDVPWPEQLMAVQYNLQGKEKMGEVVAMLLKQFGKTLTDSGDPDAEGVALQERLENFESHWAPLLRQWGIIFAG